MLDKETVKIEGIEEISNERLKSLLFLYEELIDIRAIHLYQCLIYLNHGTLYSVSQLLDILHIKEETLREMMHELERLQLIKTYKKGDEYLIDVLAPLNCNEFFASEIFDRYLATKTKDRYRSLRALLIRESSDKTDYIDISAKADLSSWSSIDEKDYRVIDEANYRIHAPRESGPTAVGKGGDPLFRRIRASKDQLLELIEETQTVQDWIQRETCNNVALSCLDNENLKEIYYEIKDGFGEYGKISLMGFKTPSGVEIPRLKVYDTNGEVLEVLTGPMAMDELNKIQKVINKEMAEADKEVLLVIDGTTGQNAISQVKAFKEEADITGLVLTKLDGTAKGGIVLSIKDQLNIPVKFIGLGEGVGDEDITNEIEDEAQLEGDNVNTNQDKQNVKADFDPVYNTKDNPSISDEEVLEYLKTMKGGTDG